MSEPNRIDNTNREIDPVRLQRLVHARLEHRSFFRRSSRSSCASCSAASGQLGFNWLIVLGIALPILAVILLGGLFTLQPNEARVLILFGAYHGTVRSSGFFWANPFYSRSRARSGAALSRPRETARPERCDRVAKPEHQDLVARPEF